MAERASARLSEARSALAFAASDVASIGAVDFENVFQSRLDYLVATELMTDAVILLPDGVTIGTTNSIDELRTAADEALASETGLYAYAGRDRDLPYIAIAQPVVLADGRVGALIARLDVDLILPDWGDGRVAMLTNNSGYVLSMRPEPYKNALACLLIKPRASTRMAVRCRGFP